MFGRLTTDEVKEYVSAKYQLLKEYAESEGIFKELGVYFGNGMPHNVEGWYVYSDRCGYHYVCTEKGNITSHQITDDLFDLSYWIFKGQIWVMASEYATKHKIGGQDFRRVYFAKELDLMALMGDNYRKRHEIAIDEILKNHPYNDAP
ncbi:MAG: Imm63 family immunity protein [Peptococcaceae bacterium]|nr:Imm63 family immunity protein [Peptococcaceae bacterium]